MSAPKRAGGVVWPVILIAFGVLFFLDNVGALKVDMWQLVISLWPLLIIAIGIDLLIGRHSWYGSLIAAMLIFGLFVGGVWLVSSLPERKTATTRYVTQPLSGASSAAVLLNLGVGRLAVDAASEAGTLVEGYAEMERGEEVIDDFRLDDGRARFAMTQRGNFIGVGSNWRLHLNPEVPLELRTETDVGAVNIDASGLHLAELEVEVNVGKAELRLPAHGRFDATVAVDIGSVVVHIPQSLPAHIHVDSGLARTEVSGDYREKEGDYFSPGYETADERVYLAVECDIGSVEVRQDD